MTMKNSHRHIYLYAVCLWMLCLLSPATSANWGANYFPNVPLQTHEGKTVRFFDDVIKDKVVVINFIYTYCPDTCPLETAQLVKVQNIMGDRLGKDVFFYSISIDPERDSPEVLKDYRDKFKARWTFLTGKESDIIQLRKKLGLYIEEIQDGSNNHNVNMIIGNQATGRWMKRSPFENPYVLADQIGNWLTDWKKPVVVQNYADAPELRSIPRGEQIFRTRCETCHTLTGKEPKNALGPDLLGVSQRRDAQWLLNWLRAPDQMLADKDPIAMELYERYNQLAMPNMRLNRQEAEDLLVYINDETSRLWGTPKTAESQQNKEEESGDVVAVMNAWIREAVPGASVNAGYMTLINVCEDTVTLEKVESPLFKKIEVHEMAMRDGLMHMQEVSDLSIAPNAQMALKPGGKHLMLINPKEELSVGQKVDMTLTFASGQKQTVTLTVAAK